MTVPFFLFGFVAMTRIYNESQFEVQKGIDAQMKKSVRPSSGKQKMQEVVPADNPTVLVEL
jgi:hypothetical protein